MAVAAAARSASGTVARAGSLARRIAGVRAGWIAGILLATLPVVVAQAPTVSCARTEARFLMLGVRLAGDAVDEGSEHDAHADTRADGREAVPDDVQASGHVFLSFRSGPLARYPRGRDGERQWSSASTVPMYDAVRMTKM